MEELIVSNDELKKMFEDKKLLDTDNGWFWEGDEVDILAMHTKEPKHVMDITRTDFYKLVKKEIKILDIRG